jgi:hypothetical protein
VAALRRSSWLAWADDCQRQFDKDSLRTYAQAWRIWHTSR